MYLFCCSFLSLHCYFDKILFSLYFLYLLIPPFCTLHQRHFFRQISHLSSNFIQAVLPKTIGWTYGNILSDTFATTKPRRHFNNSSTHISNGLNFLLAFLDSYWTVRLIIDPIHQIQILLICVRLSFHLFYWWQKDGDNWNTLLIHQKIKTS